MNKPLNGEYLRVADAARLLGVSSRWIYLRIRSGELPASLVGKLYFIRKSDLQALLEGGRVSGTSLEDEEEEAEEFESAQPPARKCAYCFRLLTSDTQVGEECHADGCGRVICAQCNREGIFYCVQHHPTREQQYESALQRFRSGEISLLVRAADARLYEVSYLNRLQERIASITSLIHPQTGTVVNAKRWQDLLQDGDERLEVMRLLGTGVLDAATTSRTPLNAWVHYHLPPADKKGAALDVHAQVFSRLPVMLRDGFDTHPLTGDDLNPHLLRLAEAAQQDGVFTLLSLASITGWDESARRLVTGGEGTIRPFAHRFLLVYLFDIQNWELIANPRDDRSRMYANFFNPLLPSEEVDHVAGEVEKKMVGYTTLPLNQAVTYLLFPRALLREAFKRLEESRRYQVVEDKEFGTTLVRL